MKSSCAFSFEFFPPKTEKHEQDLLRAVQELAPLQPAFVSVTYGAGGSTRKRTHKIVTQLNQQYQLKAAAHLTTVSHTREEIADIARDYWNAGIRHIVALRGDPPAGLEGSTPPPFVPHPQGYAYACEMIADLKKIANFEISVAAFPQGHPESKNSQEDMDTLKKKIDAGATRAITQFFFTPQTFLRFRDLCDKSGIKIPIVPGILPVTQFATLTKFSATNGLPVPEWMHDLFEGLADNPKKRQLVAAALSTELCRILQKEGVQLFHFYTLNRADLTFSICRMLQLSPDFLA